MKEKITHKKKIVIFAIIIVVLIVVGTITYFVLAPKSISGDWELVVNPEITQTTEATSDKTENQKNAYYTFSNPGEYGDGTYTTYYDGGIEQGKYKLSDKDGKKYINLGTEELEYVITKSEPFGKAQLTITYPEYTDEQTEEKVPSQDYIFEQAKAPNYENEAYDTFETDKILLNEWTTKERKLYYYAYKLSYTETVNFYDNGIMTIHYESTDLALNRCMYYAYTVKNGKLTFSLVTDKDTKYTVSYKLDEKGNLKFSNDETSSSIFSDEFFADVTYYKSKS